MVAWATTFGIAQAQYPEPAGTVQLGQPGFDGGQPLPPGPSGVSDFGTRPRPSGTGAMYGMTQVDRLFAPRVNIDSRGGGLYGYQAGYSNIGVFAPYKLEEDAIVFVHGMGLITYDGRGGATVGTGWRYYMENLDRITGLSVWFDFDNGHAKPFQQVGLSYESLGRYVDYRVNGYIPISNPDHVLYSQVTTNAILNGNGISLIRNNTVEQSYTGFDAEMGGPTPILGRYGLNAYIGGYYFMGNGQHGGDTTGVSGRLLSQINEDVSFGVQVTNDHLFGLNTQFQVFANLPDGKPSRWFRNPRVRERLVANVFRQNRVMANTASYQTYDTAINPATHNPYFVANINPNLASGGNGSASSPFSSIAAYQALTPDQQRQYDMILVQPRSDATTTHLDTASTLTLFSGQRLLSTSIQHTFYTDNLPNVALTVPGFTAGSAPMLFNSTGGDVITLASGNTRNIEVSGFDITGSATGSGIRGNNNQAITIDNNNIHGGINGVYLTNLSGTIAANTQFALFNNNIQSNLGIGVQVTNSGSPPAVNPLEVVVQNNTFNANGNDGLKLVAQSGGSIGGIIGGTNTAASGSTPATIRSNTFSNNVANGLDLVANGGTLNFLTVASSTPSTTTSTIPAFGIINNVFTSNTFDGLHIDTKNNSIGNFDIVSNTFGNSTDSTQGNLRYGINLTSDSGRNTINIGGATSALGNGFYGDLAGAAIFNLTGTNLTTTNIQNNTILINSTVAGSAILPGFNQNNLPANDDNSTGLVNIGFTGDFYGLNFNQLYVNNNGNVTFNQPLGAFTPFPIVTNGLPMLAPFFADVDTRSGNIVSYGTGTVNGHLAFGVNWPDVRHFSAAGGGTNGLPTNNFQLVIIDRSDIAAGDFDFQFNYKQIQWEAGTASGGNAQGLWVGPEDGPARAGWTNGTSNSYELAGSGVAGALLDTGPASTSLIHNSLNSTTLGRFEFTVRNGVVTNGTPGTVNGFEINVSDNAHLATSNISNNTATGVNGYALQVNSHGNGLVDGLTVTNNNFNHNDGGIQFNQYDTSFIQAYVANNLLTQNRFNGLDINSYGSNINGIEITSTGNTVDQNVGSGLSVNSHGSGTMNFYNTGGTFNGNGGDNVSLSSNDTSTLNATLYNFNSTNSSSSGLKATSNNSSTLNLLVDSTVAGTQNSFSNNTLNGIEVEANETSYMHASIYNSLFQSNHVDGIAFYRTGAALVLANIESSTATQNTRNGLFWQGLGGDPSDPSQQFQYTANRIGLNNDVFDGNGTVQATGQRTGDGAHISAYGQSAIVLNALSTSFSGNIANGLRVDETPGAQFGYINSNTQVLTRSNFDNVTITGNGANGIMFASTTSTAVSNAGTYFDLNSVNGNSTVSNNAGDGILMQYITGVHDVLIRGDGRATPLYGTFIQGNGLDGIHADIGPFADLTTTVDSVTIGGSNLVLGNGGSGIDFEPTSAMRIQNSNYNPADSTSVAFTDWTFNTAGVGTLNVNNSLIEYNNKHGINMTGNALSALGLAFDQNGVIATRTRNGLNDAWGQLNANVTNSQIVHNVLNGVNIELLGRMGGDHSGFFGPTTQNVITFSNNFIANNGTYGIFFEQNAGEQVRQGDGTLYRRETFFNPALVGTQSLNSNNLGLQGAVAFNNGDNTSILGGFALSMWMNLETVQSTALTLTNNQVVYNGSAPSLNFGDGVKIRVGTDSYLAGDIRNNKLSGNVGTDFYIESFDAYNPATNVVPLIPASTAATPPALSTVYLDDTAQLDLRFTGNTGNTVNIVSPFNNNGNLPGNVSPNGAVYPYEGLKARFSTTNTTPRVTQLFQLDDGVNVDTTNAFISNGAQQSLFNTFDFASWNLRATADPLFPNPAFPQDYFTSPGNPFLP